MTLKQKTFSAVRWTTFSMLGKAVLMLLQMAILARLLAPSDFGLMALVAAVIAFAQIFSDMGISNAIIHYQKISREALSSLYWLNVLASTLLMLMLMLCSPWIAAWYHEPRLQVILILVSATFFINALGQQLRVTAEKNLRFQQLAGIEVSASFLGLVVAVAVAFSGGGVYALVVGVLTSTAISTALCWGILADGWRPMWRLRLGEIREFLNFGIYIMGFSLINTINMQADILIGGRVLGPVNLGAYSLPKDFSLRLAMIINPIVTRVGLPVMAKAQDDKVLLKLIYLKTLRMTASVNFPLYMIMAIFAPEIISIMFGSQWQESIPLLRVFAIWGLFRSVGNPAGSLAFALGKGKLIFFWSVGQMLIQIPIFWFGSTYGLGGLAISLLVCALMLPFPQWLIIIRPLCEAQFIEYFKQLAIPFSISILATVVGYAAALPFDGSLLRLAVGMFAGGLVYLILSRWLNRNWFSAIAELLLGRERSAKFLV